MLKSLNVFDNSNEIRSREASAAGLDSVDERACLKAAQVRKNRRNVRDVLRRLALPACSKDFLQR
jgi:hypothetical protein